MAVLTVHLFLTDIWINWNLVIQDVELLKDDMLRLSLSESELFVPNVFCTVPENGNERIRLLKENAPLTIYGEIANFDGHRFDLDKVEIVVK